MLTVRKSRQGSSLPHSMLWFLETTRQDQSYMICSLFFCKADVPSDMGHRGKLTAQTWKLVLDSD